jgi:hypothetical protein
MTSYQVWKKEGRAEGRAEGIIKGEMRGELKKARLVVLRGKWKGASADFLASLSELPMPDVELLLKGYDIAFRMWEKNNKSEDYKPKIEHLTKQEVQYLIDLFNGKK